MRMIRKNEHIVSLFECEWKRELILSKIEKWNLQTKKARGEGGKAWKEEKDWETLKNNLRMRNKSIVERVNELV